MLYGEHFPPKAFFVGQSAKREGERGDSRRTWDSETANGGGGRGGEKEEGGRRRQQRENLTTPIR